MLLVFSHKYGELTVQFDFDFETLFPLFFCSLAKNLGLFKGALKLILYLCDIPTPHLNSGMKCNVMVYKC